VHLNKDGIEVGFAHKSDSSTHLKSSRNHMQSARKRQGIIRIASLAMNAVQDSWYDFKYYWASIYHYSMRR